MASTLASTSASKSSGDAPRAGDGPLHRECAEPSERVRELVARCRAESRAVRIPYLDRLRYWIYYVRLAHRGEMVHSPTHDAVYANGFWKRGYEKYLEKINRRLERARDEARIADIPCFAQDELTTGDLRFLMKSNQPFVIRGGANGLPVKDWTLEYFEQGWGDCPVPINDADDLPEEDHGRPTKSHHYYRFRMGTIAEVAASIRAGGRARATTAEDVMHADGGRLRRDLNIPYWERVAGWDVNRGRRLASRMLAGKVIGAQMLMQPGGAFTLWHAEPGDNFFVLAQGVKTWTLAHPYYTAGMRPRVKTTTNYTGCNIDVREPDDVQLERGFAGYLGVPKVRVRLEPGDVLRVPNHWWHTADTEPCPYTLAVSIRAGVMPNLTGPGLMVLRWYDRQFHAMARSFAQQGRITDDQIGFPRASRTESHTTRSDDAE